MTYFVIPGRTTRQPQGAVRVAEPWFGRVKFAQIGGFPVDVVSSVVAAQTGSPGIGASVGGRTYSYTSGVNNHAYQVPDAPFLGPITIFGIVTPATGSTTSNYINKNSAENPNQPFYAGFESSYNGLYCVRSNASSGFKSWRPTSASISAGVRSTFAVMWSNGQAFTAPTFYVNRTSSAATQVFTANADGAVSGTESAIKVGNRDSKDACAIELIVVMSGTISASEYLSLYDNPWQLFQYSRRLYFGGGATGGGAYEIDAQPGGYAVNGTAATLARGLFVDAQPGAYTLNGTAATLARGYFINAQPGTYAVTGTASTLARGLVVNAGPGAFTLTGTDATLEKVTPGVYTIDAQPGAFALNGIDATLTYTQLNAYTIDAQPATFTISGAAATLVYAGSSIWTDIGVSATTWGDVGGATSIWTDL